MITNTKITKTTKNLARSEVFAFMSFVFVFK